MDYKAEQELEVESLQAIFADQLTEYEGNTPPGWQGPCYQMAISPSQDELSSSGSAAYEVELVFAHTASYPDEAPHIRVHSVRGLSDADMADLRHTLEEQVAANLGMAMMFALISAAQEWLADKAEGQVTLDQIDPELAKRRAEEEEEKRLAAIRSQGEAVTPETFRRWRQKYDAEFSLRNTKLDDGAIAARKTDKGPSGKQFFLSQDTKEVKSVEEEALEGDEEGGDALDFSESDEDADDGEEEESEEEDEEMLDEYLSRAT
ncbi:hypothetical protein WJX74_002921 [Apatococcus lobatus]|uniref:RWD domain-containing protein n=1 Tax=Apatococcus lobatus TaxID=904363 RepID=A0AAW1R394_9CHLO